MRSDRLDRAKLLKELRTLIVNGSPGLDGSLSDGASLIASGLVESTTLVSVALWVEDRIGREMNLADFDLAVEWDSIDAILDFVQRHAARPGGHRSRHG
ncbi:MAG TPA: hypothetical protein VIE44_09485 [Methylomirabilota bacterium]|jgi:hypothetical protein